VKLSDAAAIWRVQQMLIDADGHNDWVMELNIDLAASRERGARGQAGEGGLLRVN
jgi:hypothetical protein